jgi:hypothetical protein
MKTRLIRIIAAGLAVFALAVTTNAPASADDAAGQRVASQRADTSWG